MKNICTLTAAFVAISASAQTAGDFGGLWAGRGAMSGNAGYRPCEGVKIQIQQDAQRLTLSLRKFVCSELEYQLEPESFEINGSEVKIDGQTVGTIDGSGLTAHWKTQSGAAGKEVVTDWRTTLSFDNGRLKYDSTRTQGKSEFEAEALLDRR